MRIKGLRKMTAAEANSYNMNKGSYISKLSDDEIRITLVEHGKRQFEWSNISVEKRGNYEWLISCIGDARQESIFIVQEED